MPATDDQFATWLLRRADIMDRYDTGFGLAGVALYFLYRFRRFGGQRNWQTARELCWRCAAGISTLRPRPDALVQLSEFAQFARSYGSELELTAELAPLLEVVDNILVQRAGSLVAAAKLDPYTGAFQPGYYFARYPSLFADLLDRLVVALPSTKQLREVDRRGNYRIPTGVSHGLAFYLTFAATLFAADPKRWPLRGRIEQYLAELDRRRLAFGAHGCFFRDGNRQPSRLSLAYGDAGALFAAYGAALAIGSGQRAADCLEDLARTSNRRDAVTTGTTTNGLLYGTGGMWLFFDRLATVSGRAEFRAAAEHWRQRHLAETAVLPLAPGAAAGPYGYPAMQRLSLYEGATGHRIAEHAVALRAEDFYSIFYLNLP